MRLLYLHGFASAPHSRKAQEFRSAFAQVGVNLEVPPLDRGNFSELTLTGQLQAVEDLLQGEPAALIGSSMGGYLAALYAEQHPEVSRLVLLAPAFGFAPRWREMQGAEYVEQWKRTGFREVYHYGDRRMRKIHYGLFEDALRYPPNPDFKQPALIFHGTHDTVVPIDLTRNFANNHGNVTLIPLTSSHELTDVLDLIIERSLPFLLAP